MILRALCDLAEDEELMGDPDFEWKPVAYLVRVGEGGKYLGCADTYEVPEVDETQEGKGKGRKKPRPVAKTFKVPREPGRTSGDRANFLIDKAEYALGIDPETDPAKVRAAEKLAKRFALFRERVAQCLEATGDAGVAAVHAFLEDLAAGWQTVELPEGCAGNDLFAFVYGTESQPVTDRKAVRDYWKSLRRLVPGTVVGERLCLITGTTGPPARKHTILKHVPGAVSSGVPLVSFNAGAFESYGWKANENAVVSRQAAETYATALQRLLHPAPPDPNETGTVLPRQNLRLSADTAVCYWAATRSELASVVGDLLQVVDEVPKAYQSIWRGRVPKLVTDAALRDAFYALTLSGAQGRVIVRGWLESTVGEVAENLARYFSDIDVVRNTPKPKQRELPPQIPLRVLLESLAAHGKRENVPAPLAGQFVQAALRGVPFPLAALQRAILRARAEIGRTEWADLFRRDARVAVIKAVLNRRHAVDSPKKFKEVKPEMDPTNNNPGYVLGRLMAVIERLQQVALGDVNATVVDRYFSAASATPRAVFVRLLKNARHHARKAKDSGDEAARKRARGLERDIDQLADRFDPKHNGFPDHLSLEEQGLFILGYHQQRHWMFMTKAERAAAEAAQAEEQAAA
ncbi:MAG: type I-C CRISPR-associated protein Cas8c/Csd1 [bacterium]|nr:type I-C CRISPR-associated protein Cas8c/Csd1 [bacterium]